MFGKEAAKILNYVECFPDGFMKGTTMVKACADAHLEGFPSWEINGKVRKLTFFRKLVSLVLLQPLIFTAVLL